MRSQIVKVVLNAYRDEDRRILDYLMYTAEPMSKEFKTAMLHYLDGRDSGKAGVPIEDIRAVVREELQRALSSGVGVSPQSVTSNDDEEDVSPLDFLDQLAAMDNN